VEGLIAENVVDGEVAVVEGVITLMSQSSEQMIEDLSIMSCESSGIGLIGNGQKLPMLPTTRKWNRLDLNTLLVVSPQNLSLCQALNAINGHVLLRELNQLFSTLQKLLSLSLGAGVPVGTERPRIGRPR